MSSQNRSRVLQTFTCVRDGVWLNSVYIQWVYLWQIWTELYETDYRHKAEWKTCKHTHCLPTWGMKSGIRADLSSSCFKLLIKPAGMRFVKDMLVWERFSRIPALERNRDYLTCTCWSLVQRGTKYTHIVLGHYWLIYKTAISLVQAFIQSDLHITVTQVHRFLF